MNFSVEPNDLKLIRKIVTKYRRDIETCGYKADNATQLRCSLAAAHVNGCRSDLLKLLDSPSVTLCHDVAGIHKCVSRETGELTNHFWPRCALPEANG